MIKYPELYKEGKTKCYVCKEIKTFEECVPNSDPKRSTIPCRNHCKECNRKKSKDHYQNLNKEEKEKKKTYFKKNYYRSKERLNSLSLDEQIIRWCKHSVSRSAYFDTKQKSLNSRKDLNIEELKKLCYEGLEKYPYMTFLNLKSEKNNILNWASLDRIDSSKDYSDINNLQIIPLWLNSAKLNQSEEELQIKIIHYIKLHNLLGINGA